MKKHTSFISTIAFGFALLWGVAAHAQSPDDSIFVPAADVVPAAAGDADVGDSLAKLIALHRDMYRLILTFDAKAKQLRKGTARQE